MNEWMFGVAGGINQFGSSLSNALNQRSQMELQFAQQQQAQAIRSQEIEQQKALAETQRLRQAQGIQQGIQGKPYNTDLDPTSYRQGFEMNEKDKERISNEIIESIVLDPTLQDMDDEQFREYIRSPDFDNKLIQMAVERGIPESVMIGRIQEGRKQYEQEQEKYAEERKYKQAQIATTKAQAVQRETPKTTKEAKKPEYIEVEGENIRYKPAALESEMNKLREKLQNEKEWPGVIDPPILKEIKTRLKNMEKAHKQYTDSIKGKSFELSIDELNSADELLQ